MNLTRFTWKPRVLGETTIDLGESMGHPPESQGAFQIETRADLARLRAGQAVAGRDFHSVMVRLSVLGRPERRAWERHLNAALRSRGEMLALVGSLAGTVLYVGVVASSGRGLGGDWGLLGIGFVMIALGGAFAMMLGGWYANHVFVKRVSRLERLVIALEAQASPPRRLLRTRTLRPTARRARA